MYAGIAMPTIQWPGGLYNTLHHGPALRFACDFPTLVIVNGGYDHYTYMMLLQAGLALACSWCGRSFRRPRHWR